MPIARITGQGLIAIAFSVALLWGSVLGERALMRRALAERTQVMRMVQSPHPRLRPEPVCDPTPSPSHSLRLTAG